MRAMPAAQQLDDMAQAAMVQWLRIVRIDRILDLRKLLDVGAACEERQPVDQELAICGIVFEPERVEPRRRAGAQHVIASADRADEQLAAAVLVEEDDARIELARLREQEIERHGLSRTRRSEERRVGKEVVSTFRSRWAPYH